jgi:hypothetical protein
MVKYSWSEADNINCSLYYLHGYTPKKAQSLLSHISLRSITMKYANCLYLDKGGVKGSLQKYSKLHKTVWDEIMKNKK